MYALDYLGRSLYLALCMRDGRAAVACILRGADPRLVIRGRPVIHHAISMGDEGLMECVIAHGADVHALYDREGMTPLHLAIREVFIEGVGMLLKEHVDVELRDFEGFPPIFYALRTCNWVILDMLLASGADVNTRDEEGLTPLHVVNVPWQVVELLQRGADVNARDDYGRTPLEIELMVSPSLEVSNPIVTELLRWGADIDEGTRDAVFVLANDRDCEIELLRTIFRGTGYADSRDRLLRTALHYVAATGRVEAVRELFECGADVNARDSEGYTPLHFALGFNAGIEVVSELILKGADVNEKSSSGSTPLHVAVHWPSSQRVVEHLLREGADINALDMEGKSPLDAIPPRYSCPCMLRLLLKHSVLRNYASRTEYGKSAPWRKDFMSCLQFMFEIEHMKKFHVGRGLTVYDFVLCDEWDISFTRQIYDWIRAGKFPIYSDIVLLRLSQKVREHLKNHASDPSLFLLDLSRNSHICINQHVLIDIVKYLSDEDCLNLYIAGC